MCSFIIVLRECLVKINFLANDGLVDIEYIYVTSLKVTGSVVTLGDVKILLLWVVNRFVSLCNLHEHFSYLTQQRESGLNFFVRFVCLNSG